MNVKNSIIYYLLLFVLIFVSCAQFSSPAGGPKDSFPPVLVEESSDKNFQTNFKSKKITLTFNEWISVSNPIKEIVISPPTEYPHKVTEKGKSVILEFSENEILKENTTYQINYGDAIKDFTEGNIYKNLIFIFSTGDVIDSLSVKGTVINALTKKPQENAIVSLYDNLNDTAFVTSKPLYFTKTDKQGNFSLNNLRSDTFQIFGLTDNNVSYFYDQPDELVAFIDSTIIVKPIEGTDTLSIDLELFDEEEDPRFIEAKQKITGLVKIVYSPLPKDYNINILNADSINYSFETYKDSIFVWHNFIDRDSISINIYNNILNDTIISKKSGPSFKKTKLEITTETKNENNFGKNDPLEIVFNHPLTTFNLDSISIYDTLGNYNVSKGRISGKKLFLEIDSLTSKSTYSLDMYPSAVTDIFGNLNTDTITQTIVTNDPELFGKIELEIVAPIDTQYIIKFKDKSNTLDTFLINGPRTIILDNILKGQYMLEVIEDLNANNYWSTGNLSLKMHPERIKEIPLEELKAGWDLNLTIDIKSIFNEATIK